MTQVLLDNSYQCIEKVVIGRSQTKHSAVMSQNFTARKFSRINTKQSINVRRNKLCGHCCEVSCFSLDKQKMIVMFANLIKKIFRHFFVLSPRKKLFLPAIETQFSLMYVRDHSNITKSRDLVGGVSQMIML